MNPPCYRCESQTPLLVGDVGLCRKCAAEVEADRTRTPSTASCTGCGHFFTTDWERIQHLVRRRHNYMAWTPEQGQRAAEKMTASLNNGDRL